MVSTYKGLRSLSFWPALAYCIVEKKARKVLTGHPRHPLDISKLMHVFVDGPYVVMRIRVCVWEIQWVLPIFYF